MAVIYLKHPVHGTKVACSEFEAQDDRVNGWVDYDPATPAPKTKVVVEPPAEVEPVVPEPEAESPVVPVEPVVPSFLAPVEPVVSDLPEDLPGRDLLIAGGILTWESLVDKTKEDLIAINGIGSVTADKILTVLNS